MTRTLKHIVLSLAALLMTSSAAFAQESQAGAVQRRSGDRKRTQQNDGPQVTQRMQTFYEDAGNNISDADRQWMRVIYRHIDLDKDKNAPLYFPEENVDGQENLFRIIMRLLANNQLTAYEYLDGREVFTDQYRLNVRDLLDRFHIPFTDAKGSTEKRPKFNIEESDVPTNEVLSYYVIERWEFDTRSNRMKTVVEAICPVLHRSGDFGGEAVRYPMFWVKFNDLRPWLAQQTIFVSDDNNIPSCTYDDYFNLTMYEGDIYKTRNLKNRSMAQLYPDADDLKRAQDSINTRLTTWENKLWVPDREEVIAAKARKDAKTSKDVAQVSQPTDDEDAPTVAADEEKVEKRATRRSTKRSTKKPKQSAIKETKASKSSSATRSVRRRK